MIHVPVPTIHLKHKSVNEGILKTEREEEGIKTFVKIT